MRRRVFLYRLLFSVPAVLLTAQSVHSAPPDNPLAVVHRGAEDATTIQIRGLKRPVVVQHLSDAHVSVLHESERPYWQYASRMDTGYGVPRPHFQTGPKALPLDHLRQLLDTAKARRVDLVALTGDIVNNPSRSSVQSVCHLLQETGLRWLYVAGNHDWHYEGMPGTEGTLRETWTRRSLLPLYAGGNPLCYAMQLGGLNFVAIDNSTYQVDAAQLAFYERQAARGLPTVLLLHIPLWTGGNADKHVSHCGDPRWGWDADHVYQIERRQRWPKSGNLPSTTDFVRRVKATPNLVAVLAGHTHRARADRLSASAVQYVVQAACNGGSRLVSFQPSVQPLGQ